MPYNHGKEERKWQRWKLAEEKVLRACGMDESTIEQLRLWDRAMFNSDRRFYEQLQDTGTYLDKRFSGPLIFAIKLALHLSFACSLRLGELLGLTWDCIDISPESIESGKAYVYIDKELQRVSRKALSQTEEHGVKLKFPSILACRHTVLVLKEPKTKTSVRKVFLPRTVAEMLVERKKDIGELKELLGNEYADYNLVFASSSRTPTEGSTINRLFSKLISDNGLPKVVFHSIRHTSTTYKLMLSGGDIKGVQGDTGHAQASIVTERYAHILDDNLRMNAEMFQQQFYSGSVSEERAAQPDPLQQLDAGEKQALLIKLLAESLEMATMFKSLAKVM